MDDNAFTQVPITFLQTSLSSLRQSDQMNPLKQSDNSEKILVGDLSGVSSSYGALTHNIIKHVK